MKTLKKTLSLTLVFAMVFSLMSFAFAAPTATTTAAKAPKLSDFTDADQLTYTEAADYLIAAGVVKGDTATTLNPKGDFTRAQAAKLVAYAALGQIAADNLKASVAPFKDVDASNWAAGYIAYCQKQGLVNGYGDGNFGPNDKVTGYQIGKMLLCSLGYGVNGEFTGFGWTLEVAKYALAKDIFYGNTAGASNAAVTREEAFLYTCNALNRAMLVKYNDNLKVYYSGTNPFEDNQKFHEEYTIGYQRFMMRYVASDGTYDEPAHYWAIDGKKVTGIYPNDPITKLATATSGVPYANLTAKGDPAYIGYSADKTVVYYLNSDKATKADVENASKYKGEVINFYDTDKNGKYDTVEALAYSVVKLTAAPVVATAGGNSVVTIADMNMSKIVDENIDGDYASLKKDDYVLYYSNAKKTAWTIAKCETVSGQLYGFNKDAGQLNVNGTNYSYSQIVRTGSGLMEFDQICDAKGLAGTTFYLDAGKNICAAEPTQNVVAAGNVVFVLTSNDYVGTVSAKVLKADGTTSVKTVSKMINSAGNVVAPPTGTPDALAGKFYTFTEDANGALVLKLIADVVGAPAGVATQDSAPSYANNNMVFEKGKANFFYKTGNVVDTAVKGTNKTVFVLEGSTTNTKGTYKAYTGVSAIPNVTAYDYTSPADGTIDTTAYVLTDKDGYAIMAVALKGNLDTKTLALDYAFVGFTASTVAKTSNASENYYNYPIVAVNGEVKTTGMDATINTINPGLAVIDAYDNGKVDGVFSPANPVGYTTDKFFTDTRVERVIFDLFNPGHYTGAGATQINTNDLMNVTKTGFKVNGDTVTFNSIGAGAQSFVVSKDVKVFYHDCTNAYTTGKITLDKQGSINALESLPKTDADTTYTYGVSALSVSKDDPTINELYVTIYPQKAAGSDVPSAPGKYSSAVDPTVGNASLLDLSTKASVDGANVLKLPVLATADTSTQINEAMGILGYTNVSMTKASTTYTITATKSSVVNTITCNTASDVTNFYPVTVDGKLVAYMNGTDGYTFAANISGKGTGYITDVATAGTFVYAAYDKPTVKVARAVAIKTGYVSVAAVTAAPTAYSTAIVNGKATLAITGVPAYVKVGGTITVTLAVDVNASAAAKSDATLTVTGAGATIAPVAKQEITRAETVAGVTKTWTVTAAEANITAVSVAIAD